MRKKIIVAFLGLGMLAMIFPLTVQAEIEESVNLDLQVFNLGRVKLGPCYYRFYYQIYNHGPDDLVNADFWDAGGYKLLGGKWITHTNSWIHHTNLSIEANQYSPYYSWQGYMPSGCYWFCQCTDEYNNITETNENNNCNVKFWCFW